MEQNFGAQLKKLRLTDQGILQYILVLQKDLETM